MNLDDSSLLRTKAYINGEWVEAPGGKRFDVTNPSNAEVIASVPDMGAEDLKGAIDATYVAQKDWAARTAKERSGVLRRWRDLMMENQDDLAVILTSEMGKPLAEAKGEIAYGAGFLEWFAEEAKRVYGDVIPSPQADRRIAVIKQPVGVVGSITPWNFPSAMIARKVGPALAVGCAVVEKPAEDTPLSALAMAELGERAGIPPGIFNVVTGMDASALGAEMCANDKVRKVTFTGSTEVGRILMRQCADGIKKLSLELGGNAPFIVFDDADLDAAVEGAMASKYRNSGQTCVCSNRIFAHETIYDEFAAKLAAAVERLSVGDGFDRGTTTGPLINETAVEKVEAHIADAVEQGAAVLVGGGRHELGGTYFQPTVLKGATREMRIFREETFGPVAPILKFRDTEDVIEQANDTIYGLAAYFYARDLSRVWRVAEALEYGMIGVNSGVISTEAAPFGGMKQSGLGREGSKYGIDDYVEMKYICFGGI